MKIAVTTTSFGKYDSIPLQLCEDEGFSVSLNPYGRKVTSDELIELAKDAVGIIAGTENISENVLLKLPWLKVISRCGVGLDSVDIGSAKKLGIEVLNTPDAPTLAVAELTICLIMNLLRKPAQMNKEICEGIWKKRMGLLLCGKNVGIIGFGRIGRKVADLLYPFCCRVAFYDPFVESSETGIEKLPLDDLLLSADIVTMHVSVNDRIIGNKELRMMRKGSFLVNVSRGGVIDEQALYNCLKEAHLSGAALDVFESEPYKGKLRELDNVMLTPHIGSYAREARIEMEKQAVKNLIKGLKKAGTL